jgi:hypothetical protein
LASAAPLDYLVCDEEVRFGSRRAAPATYLRRLEYRSWAADMMRNRLAGQGTTPLGDETLKQVQAAWPGIVQTAPVEVTDDAVGNCLVIAFTYELPDCWKPSSRAHRLAFEATDLLAPRELAPLPGTGRKTDIQLGRPRRYRRRFRAVMPCRWRGKGWRQAERAPGLNYLNQLSINGGEILHTKELMIDSWSIPAASAVEYAQIVGKLRENRISLFAAERLGLIRPFVDPWFVASQVAFCIACAILFAVVLILYPAQPDRPIARSSAIARCRPIPSPVTPSPISEKHCRETRPIRSTLAVLTLVRLATNRCLIPTRGADTYTSSARPAPAHRRCCSTLIAQDLTADQGLAVPDPHGNLAETVQVARAAKLEQRNNAAPTRPSRRFVEPALMLLWEASTPYERPQRRHQVR